MFNQMNRGVRRGAYSTSSTATLDDIAEARAHILEEIGVTEAELRSHRLDRSEAEVRALRHLDALMWGERGI